MNKIVVHTMPDCVLCIKCKELLNYWNIHYCVVHDKPPYNEQYPIIFINDKKISYKKLVEMIAEGEIK